MSTSQHPIALRLERLVGGETKLLAIVMGLPLIDGIFPALVLAGALENPLDAIQVGLLIFGGSATLAVILAEMDGTPREQAGVVLLVGLPLIVVAGLQAALAPAIGSVLDLATFERFAALVIAAVAAKTASARIGDYLPRPAVVVALGLVASLDPAGAEFVVLERPALVANAVMAAGVGVAFALAVALLGPHLREQLDVDRFRFGSAVALGLLPLSLLGTPFGNAPLAVLGVTALFALEPDGSADEERSAASTADAVTDGGTSDDGETESPVGGTDDDCTDDMDGDPGPYSADDSTDTDGRAPWL